MIDLEILNKLFQSSYDSIITIALISIFISSERTLAKGIVSKFVYCIISTFLLLISDSLDFIVQQQNLNHAYWLVIAAFGYTLRICSMGFLVALTQRKSKITCDIIYGIMVVNAIVAFISIKTGWIFSLSDNGVWKMGPLYGFPYFVTCIYTVMMFLTIKEQLYSNKSEVVMIIIIIVFSLLANIMELTHLVRLALARNFIICIVIYFIVLNISNYRRDSVTELLNRLSFDTDSALCVNKNCIFICMDLNDLKKLNDTEGHEAGDLALKTVATHMKKTFSKYGPVYRTGGDEFVSIIRNPSVENTKKLIYSFQESLKETPYQVACGFVVHEKGKDISSTLRIGDEKMYEDKRLLKNLGITN